MATKKLTFVSADNQRVSIEISITDKDNKQRDWITLEPTQHKALSIHGNTANGWGQIYDDFVPTPSQKKLVDFWKEYHLNDLCAGTKAQMDALKECKSTDYSERCKFLEERGLFFDRGYKFGTAWLAKSFPEDELEAIIKEIEDEVNANNEKKASALDTNLDIDEDSDELVEYVTDKLDKPNIYISQHDAKRVIAFMRSQGIGLEDLDEIEVGTNTITIYGETWFVDDEDYLREIARERLEDDRDLWVDAVQNERTDMGFDDWIDEVLDNDGYASILNNYDGRSDSQLVCGEWFEICRDY